MIPHAAIGIDAAGTGTGVLAPLVLTSLVRRAIVVDDTFWTTVGRHALDPGQTGAVAAVPNRSWRVGVRPTGVGLAWVLCHDRLYG